MAAILRPAADGEPAGVRNSARWRRERNRRYRIELEHYLRQSLVDEYQARAEAAWRRDYTDEAAYARSIEPNRERWARFLGAPPLAAAGPAEIEPYPVRAGLATSWIRVPLTGGLTAEGLLAVPDGAGRAPVVVVQHGIASTPETTFGAPDDSGAYHECALALVRAGFAVLAPFNIAGIEERNRLQRLAFMDGRLIEGVELSRLRCLLDTLPEIGGVDPERLGMWGQSWGGLATQYWLPLEPRIRAGVVSAYFNDRLAKMAVPDPRYTCFLETAEVHAHHPGLLAEFADADLVSLICPRPLLVQHGRADNIGWAPAVSTEFERARRHWAELGHGERMALHLHEGGHEVDVDTALRWFGRWL
ncbi:alpha/beta hydrolase family protein [Jiangella asiatica]|uniref:Dienelactone hydrolase domain-containing protein n=1 Tax=Jiangella asiatica TaxID=2530372 RepID=A0A4R5DHQ8_9ACTN|nr:hypothetical protein [Jiangella asiatica]TDE11460.1 hypothetical protein E1269_09330 [Jiangella asiatica]